VVVPWKHAFKGNLDSYKSHKRRKECEEEHWRQMMEQRLKEQEEKMRVEIEWRLAVTISQIAKIGALPEVPLEKQLCFYRGCTRCLHRRPWRVEGNRRSSSGWQPTIPSGFSLSVHPVWAAQAIRQHHNAGGVRECFCAFSWTD
jgi:hypothetical protein